jgi:hypothetical protein
VPRKKNRLQFALTEEKDGTVRVTLAIDGARILEFKNAEAPSVAVRWPKARDAELLDHAEYWSRRNPQGGDVSAWLQHYVGSREKDLVKHILEIRKGLRKLAGTVRNANTAKKLLRDLRT